MLSSLKEKLSTVQDGIISSLNKNDDYIYNKREFLAGARLLLKYQNNWHGIHTLSEQNALQAKVVHLQIEDFNKCMKHNWQILRKFTSVVGDLKYIATLAEKALNAIGSIRLLTNEVKWKIVELEDLIEEEKEQRDMLYATDRLTHHHYKKNMALDALRGKLAEDYAIRLKLMEEEREDLKRKTFVLAEKKFLEDLNAYKESGILPQKNCYEENMLKIEEVELELDLSSLQEYLDEP